jgi:hypothetical protein
MTAGGGGQALAQLLGQELEGAVAAAAVGFWGDGLGDAPVIVVALMHGKDPGQALAAGVGAPIHHRFGNYLKRQLTE